MSLPYPTPTEVPTKLRCQFSMPGRKYNCRSIGKYVLNGRRFCAIHYDTAWKVSHPEFGSQHDWHIHVNRFTGEPAKYPTCRRCGAIQVYEGLPQCLCRGRMAAIELRGA